MTNKLTRKDINKPCQSNNSEPNNVAQTRDHSRTRMVQMGLRPKPQPHHEINIEHIEKEK